MADARQVNFSVAQNIPVVFVIGWSNNVPQYFYVPFIEPNQSAGFGSDGSGTSLFSFVGFAFAFSSLSGSLSHLSPKAVDTLSHCPICRRID
jgi:hypothetical protein